jgi:hypothetical protein
MQRCLMRGWDIGGFYLNLHKIYNMGLVRAKIELVNTSDVSLFENKVIGKNKIRRVKMTALVNTGAGMMTINENIKDQLGLKVRGKRFTQLADGTVKELEIARPP